MIQVLFLSSLCIICLPQRRKEACHNSYIFFLFASYHIHMACMNSIPQLIITLSPQAKQSSFEIPITKLFLCKMERALVKLQKQNSNYCLISPFSFHRLRLSICINFRKSSDSIIRNLDYNRHEMENLPKEGQFRKLTQTNS